MAASLAVVVVAVAVAVVIASPIVAAMPVSAVAASDSMMMQQDLRDPRPLSKMGAGVQFLH